MTKIVGVYPSLERSCYACEPRDDCTYLLRDYGYCCYSVSPKGGVLIFNLYIYPYFRRQGNARELLSACIEAIRETGYIGDITIEAKPIEDSVPVEELKVFYKEMGLCVL